MKYRTPSHEMPDYRLSFTLPSSIFAVSEGDTSVAGVKVLPGRVVEARGKDWEWVLKQAGTYVGMIANGSDLVLMAVLERGDDPALTIEAPAKGRFKRTRDMIYVAGPSVVFTHNLKKPLVVSVPK